MASACKVNVAIAKVVLGFMMVTITSGIPLNAQETTRQVFWKEYLRLKGEKLGCYFTFENVVPSGGDPHRIKGRLMYDDSIDSIDEVIAKISREVKGLYIWRNKDNPKVVHVMDRRLLELKGYALDKRIDVEFSGVPSDLTWELAKHVQNLAPRTSGDNTKAFGDHVTKITVRAKDRQVRDILTECIPLQEYVSFLWWADTTLDCEPASVVQFYGWRKKERRQAE